MNAQTDIERDATSLRQSADASFAQLTALLGEQRADLERLEALHEKAATSQFETVLQAVIAHNLFCRNLLKQRLAVDYWGWCPLRHKAVVVGTSIGDKCRYHTRQYRGDHGTEYIFVVYILPILDFEVGQLLPAPNYPARLEDNKWWFQQVRPGGEDGDWEEASPKTKVFDMFNSEYAGSERCDPGLIIIADEYGIPPQLLLRRNHVRSRFEPRYFLEETQHFPLQFQNY